ncbi:cell division protein FtsL [Aliikangiella coralliicola]|uniref:Cell division protein FtsL n=1 Tax=Aliikangiella coralliicola TaxID=2592383 RepID=A0A545UK47_9GAMM|nr:cell division protein FtsL [Aliikangiella coralliicola]TQV89829.1 cell division protein FtsL [Aliikangiella coralliicola]
MAKKKQKKVTKKAPALLVVLLSDIFVRHWVVTALALLFVSSSMMIAHTSHSARRLTAEWQELRQQHRTEQVNWESLRLELTTLSEPDRISSQAKKQLGMVEVTTKNEKVISL